MTTVWPFSTSFVSPHCCWYVLLNHVKILSVLTATRHSVAGKGPPNDAKRIQWAAAKNVAAVEKDYEPEVVVWLFLYCENGGWKTSDQDVKQGSADQIEPQSCSLSLPLLNLQKVMYCFDVIPYCLLPARRLTVPCFSTHKAPKPSAAQQCVSVRFGPVFYLLSKRNNYSRFPLISLIM